MSLNLLVFYTSGGISSGPAVFLLSIFVSTMLSSFSVTCPSLMSSGLLIIFVIGLSVKFAIRFLKCSFHFYILSSWLGAFSFVLEVLFLLSCYSWLSIYRISNFIDCPWMYSSCSFLVSASLLWAFLSYCALTFDGFLLLNKNAIFMLSRFS